MTMNDVKTNHACELLKLALHALEAAPKGDHEHDGETTTFTCTEGTVTVNRTTGEVAFTPDE